MSVFPSSVSAPAASPAVASAAPNIPSRLRRPRTMMKTAMLINLVLIAASHLPSALAAPFYPTATYPIVLKKLTVDRTASRLSGTIWVYEIPGGSYTSYAYIKILDSKKEVITGSGGQATRTTPQVTDNVFAYTFSGVDPLSLDNYADTVLTTS
ncbi:hypothetical protein DFJ73DRAFT_402003 [Zopfochytrium polystomum]|nr:hypothetical protein DFJ73DRAFT_402003 [Zopfochytrium polystomum]